MGAAAPASLPRTVWLAQFMADSGTVTAGLSSELRLLQHVQHRERRPYQQDRGRDDRQERGQGLVRGGDRADRRVRAQQVRLRHGLG